MKVKPLEGADISLVYIDEKWGLPYCTKHGAMLTVNRKVWRCMGVRGEVIGEGARQGASKVRTDDNGCRAGCVFEQEDKK